MAYEISAIHIICIQILWKGDVKLIKYLKSGKMIVYWNALIIL